MHLRSGTPSIEHLLELPPAVTLSLVVSLDGQLCGADGSSRGISAPEDLDWLRRLRAAADVVVVGAATAEREGYRPISVRPEYAAARREAGLAAHPDLLVVRRADDVPALLRGCGPRVLLEAGVRLHTALGDLIDRVWLSHAPVVVGDVGAAYALPMEHFALSERWTGEGAYPLSRFDRVSRR